MDPFRIVRLIQVSNNRNDHKSQVVHVCLIEASVEYRYFLVTEDVGGGGGWDLSCCLLNRGCSLNMGPA